MATLGCQSKAMTAYRKFVLQHVLLTCCALQATRLEELLLCYAPWTFCTALGMSQIPT